MDAKTLAARIVPALSLAVLLAIARPAAACEADEVPCGSQCMPADGECCASIDLGDYWCPSGYTCWGDGWCEGGTGPTQGQEVVDANGAPYGPSLERSCGIGRGAEGGRGGLLIAVAGALGWLVRRRGRR